MTPTWEQWWGQRGGHGCRSSTYLGKVHQDCEFLLCTVQLHHYYLAGTEWSSISEQNWRNRQWRHIKIRGAANLRSVFNSVLASTPHKNLRLNYSTTGKKKQKKTPATTKQSLLLHYWSKSASFFSLICPWVLEHPVPSTAGEEDMWLILTLEKAALGDTWTRAADRWFWWNHIGFPSKCSWVRETDKLLLEEIFYTPIYPACRLQSLSLLQEISLQLSSHERTGLLQCFLKLV